jgi:hypothetical protein
LIVEKVGVPIEAGAGEHMRRDHRKRPATAPQPIPARTREVDDSTGPPRPVRESLDPSGAGSGEQLEPTLTSLGMEMDGQEWTVRVDGRDRAGSPPSDASLLLLGFYRTSEAESPEREGWVVGRDLSDLSEAIIERAFRDGRPPPDPSRRAELFPETASKGRRGK